MACDRALALLDGVEAELDLEPADDASAALRDECLALRAVLVMTTGDYELGAELAGRSSAATRQAPWVANAVRNVIAASHLHAGAGATCTARSRWSARRAKARGRAIRCRSTTGCRSTAWPSIRQGHLDDAALRARDRP